ncbi:hypothetical protein Btru_040424 [Bulinus truncatus]|nr:hypothetical protein Btru_040424 [Bulinus truncatus]
MNLPTLQTTQPNRPANKWGQAVVPNINLEALAAAKIPSTKAPRPPAAEANEASDAPKPTEPAGKAAVRPPTGLKTALVPNKLPVPANPSNALNKEDKSPDRAEPINKPWTKAALTPSLLQQQRPAQHHSLLTGADLGHKVAQTLRHFTVNITGSHFTHTCEKLECQSIFPPSVTTSSPATTPVPVPETTPSATSGTAPGLSSQSSQETVDENGRGKFDFRSQMKPRNSITSLGSHSEPEVILRSSPGMKPASVQDKKRQSSNIIIERKSDQKKFKKIKLTTLPPESAVPAKPTLPSGIDLTQIKVEFQKKIQDLKAESDEVNAAVNDDDDEIYDEGCSAPSPVLPRKPTFKRNSERVSMIPDMPPEEEGEIYDDGISQPIASDDIYADGETEKKEDSDFEDVYEDEESFSKPVETEEDKKKRLKEEAEAKKREEKERKEKEKLEKELKKKEDKEKKEKAKLIKKLNMTGNETSAGEGTIKQDSKGSGLNLTVKKGQTVTILRLENNPANKWLIKTDENTFGYVDSKNIEVDPSIIRKAMGNARKNSRAPDEDDQPTYDEPPDGTAGDDIEEEIYEEL